VAGRRVARRPEQRILPLDVQLRVFFCLEEAQSAHLQNSSVRGIRLKKGWSDSGRVHRVASFSNFGTS
jgi:hypothetical protein